MQFNVLDEIFKRLRKNMDEMYVHILKEMYLEFKYIPYGHLMFSIVQIVN
jgi:hypothetical protein